MESKNLSPLLNQYKSNMNKNVDKVIKTYNGIIPDLKDFPAQSSDKIEKGVMFPFIKKNGALRSGLHNEISKSGKHR